MPSLKDIARKSGVSLSTVSRALNDSPLISEPVTKKVKRIATRLGYTPNVQAKVLAGRQAKIVGFMAQTLTWAHDLDVMRGIENAAKDAGYSVLICLGFGDDSRVETYRQLLNQPLFDGIIVGFSGWEWRKQSLGGKPVVYVDQWPEDIGEGAVVTSDHDMSAVQITDFFAARNVGKVVYVGGGKSNSVEKQRYERMRARCRGRSMSFRRVSPAPRGFRSFVAACGQSTQPYGVVFEPGTEGRLADFRPAQEALQSCYAAVFDNRFEGLDSLCAGGISITQDHVRMGGRALEHLVALIAGDSPPSRHLIPTDSVVF